MKELGGLLIIVIIVWILWYVGGGPERYNPKDGVLIQNPTRVRNESDFRY